MRSPIGKLVRWLGPDGTERTRAFEPGHEISERKSFLENLLRNGDQVLAGSTTLVEDLPDRPTKRRGSRK